MSFKRFLIWSSGGPSVPWSKSIYAILKEGIRGNTHVCLNEIWSTTYLELWFSSAISSGTIDVV